MEEALRKEKEFLRAGIQEAYLCSEFLTRYLEKGPVRDENLKNLDGLVKSYCLLDNMLDVRPDIVESMSREQRAKIEQRENEETPMEEDTKSDFAKILSEKVAAALKKNHADNHLKMKDYKKKVTRLVNKADGTGADDDLMVTDESSNLTDPLSKTEFVDPVISTTCQHRFSRRTVMQHLKQHPRCPYVGCKQKLSINDLEDDLITAQTLKQLQLRRQMLG